MLTIKHLSLAAVASVCTISAVGTAQAATVTSNFQVDVNDGPLAGQSFSGSFQYDDSFLTNSGFEELTSDDGLLGISFNFLGVNFTEEDNIFSPSFSTINFQDGSLLGLSYTVFEGLSSGSTSIPDPVLAFGTNNDLFAYLTDTADVFSGSVTYEAQSIPTPALLPGLFGMGIAAIRKKRKAEVSETVAENAEV